MLDQTANPEKLGFDQDRLARIRPWMQRWVDQGKFPGAQLLIARHGEVAYHDFVGQRDIENALPWERDTIVRIYSMTKPITSVAFLMCYEEALVHLDTPVDEFIPEFADRQVLIEGATSIDQIRPATTRMTVHHLLTHTSGLTYGFNEGILSEEMEKRFLNFAPRRPGADRGGDDDPDSLGRMVGDLARLPLAFNPGARWNYGVSTDVLGRVIEVISGQSLEEFLIDRIFQPLGMADTGFSVPEEKHARLAACYARTPGDPLTLADTASQTIFSKKNVAVFSGGGGLTSTISDYLHFAEMLRCKGMLGGERLLAPKTVEIMTSNALPGDLTSMGQPVFTEVPYDGIGFGLGVYSTINPGLAKTMCSVGDFGWGGVASTSFWVDPVHDLVSIFLTQLQPSSSYPVRKEARALVYSSLTDP